MATRRAWFGLALGAAATTVVRQTGSAQPAHGQRQTPRKDGLQDRGAPTGRVGAATRGGPDGGLGLDLVAPLHGVGLTSVDQPELCYLLSGRTMRPLRLTISTPGLARPLANLDLPANQPSDLGIVRLRDYGVKLTPDRLCVWSVTLTLDPRSPSQDLVASALIQYRPDSPALRAADRQAPLSARIAALARAGYWYDAVTLAQRNQATEGAPALAALFRQEDLSR